MTFIVSCTKVVPDEPHQEVDGIKIVESLEEAWQEYNKICAELDTVSAFILIPIKEFKR